MADLQWYKERFDKQTEFLIKHIHPRYGSCDGLGEDGECSECLRVLGLWKAAFDMQQAQGRIMALPPRVKG